MKKLKYLIFIILFLGCSHKRADQDLFQRSRQIFQRWDYLYHQKDVSALVQLYGSEVFFDDKMITSKKLRKILKNKLKTKNHRQLIGDVKYFRISSGEIRCDFSEQIVNSKSVYIKPGYLFIKESMGRFVIIGECSNDALNIAKNKLKIGNSEYEIYENLVLADYLPLIILAFLVTAIILIIRDSRKVKTLSKSYRKVGSYILADEPKVAKDKINTVQTLNTSKSKGTKFEVFVQRRFPVKYYSVMEWRSDKFYDIDQMERQNIQPAESDKNPDFVFRHKKSNARFAVECKYRNPQWMFEYPEIISKKQVLRYKYFADNERIEVFIVLGIGESVNNPEDIYIIPLKLLPRKNLTYQDLEMLKDSINKYQYVKSFRFSPESGFLHAQ